MLPIVCYNTGENGYVKGESACNQTRLELDGTTIDTVQAKGAGFLIVAPTSVRLSLFDKVGPTSTGISDIHVDQHNGGLMGHAQHSLDYSGLLLLVNAHLPRPTN